MADHSIGQRARRALPDLVALGLAVVLGAGLLGLRACGRRADGGLTQTRWSAARPGPDLKPLGTVKVSTVDLDYRQGPALSARVKAVRYEGWVWIPYRGHFVFALLVRGQAELTVGTARPLRAASGPITTEHGHRVHPRRLHKEQRLLDRGWHALRLDARLPAKTGALRLLWLPPGRRGVPEYVEPAMLRPRGPRPTAPGHVGPTPRDRWIASSLLALLLVLLGFWLRRPLVAGLGRLRSDTPLRTETLGLLALFAAGLALRLWGLGDAGQTWDEDVYFSAGRNQWLNLLSLDFRATSWQWNLEHPPVTRYLVGLGSLFGEGLNSARALSALCGALLPPVVYLAGRSLFDDRRVGWVAAAVAVVLPSLLAHSRVAGHESVSVLLYSLTCLLMIRALRQEGEARAALVGAAVCGGLLVGCRLANLTAWFFVAAVAMWIAWPRLRRREPLPLPLLLLPVVGAAVFFAVWPRLWSSPARHLGELLTYWHPDAEHREYFLGQLVRRSAGYFPLYLVVTTPVAVLAGLALFFVRLGVRRRRAELLVVLWLAAPLAAAPLLPFHRDGVRYVLPAVVPLVLGAAAGTVWLAHRLTARLKGRARHALVVALALVVLFLPTAWAAVAVQPYQLDYYNRVSGGPEAALKKRRYEWSWWGEGMAGSVAYLRRHARPPARVAMDVPARHTVVLHPDVRTTRPGRRPTSDFLLYAGEGLRRLWDPRRRRWNHPPGYRVVYEETVRGVPLSRVYRRK